MNYYSHHIGDFNNATRHLTRVERSLYRDAIELYYDTESVLDKDFKKLSRRLLAHSDEEKEALKTILSEFFVETDDGYFHVRCDEEITKYRANASAKAKAGIASAEARKQKSTRVEQMLNTRESDVQLTNNQQPITNNHKPINKTHTVENCNSDGITEIGRVCLAIKSEFDLQNKPITDMNQSNPTFIALVNAGATSEEFADAARVSASKGKGFKYLLSIVKNQREDAAKLNLHQGKLPPSSSREAGRQIAALSFFTPENTQHLQGVQLKTINEINYEQPAITA